MASGQPITAPTPGQPREVLSLGQSLVEAFWKARDPHTERILNMMGGAEDWRLDEQPVIAAALAALAPRLDRAGPDAIRKNLGILIETMGWMSSARALRLMDWLDTRHGTENLTGELLEMARQSDAKTSRLLLDRLRVLHSMRLLIRIFSQQRVDEIAEILGETGGAGS